MLSPVSELSQGIESRAMPKQLDTIEFKGKAEDVWKEASVIGRAGKVTGKNKDWFNVSCAGESFSLNLGDVDWRFKERKTEVANVTFVPKMRHNDSLCVAAKQQELESFLNLNVYEEVEDVGQERVSSRWILTEKTVVGKKRRESAVGMSRF